MMTSLPVSTVVVSLSLILAFKSITDFLQRLCNPLCNISAVAGSCKTKIIVYLQVQLFLSTLYHKKKQLYIFMYQYIHAGPNILHMF